jgi:hypothetical protein
MTLAPTNGPNDNGSDYFTPMAAPFAIEPPQQPIDPLTAFLEAAAQSLHGIDRTFVCDLSRRPLKALFIPPSSNFQPHFWPVAPDEQLPLAQL